MLAAVAFKEAYAAKPQASDSEDVPRTPDAPATSKPKTPHSLTDEMVASAMFRACALRFDWLFKQPVASQIPPSYVQQL